MESVYHKCTYFYQHITQGFNKRPWLTNHHPPDATHHHHHCSILFISTYSVYYRWFSRRINLLLIYLHCHNHSPAFIRSAATNRDQNKCSSAAASLLVFANNLWARFVVGITFYLDSFCGQINTICELFKQNNPMVIKIMDSECRLWVNADGRISGGAVELMNERNRSSIVIP